MTSATGVTLIVLLAIEGVTILFIRPLISMHVFVGLLLVPPVALKLASTGWRFASYYARRAEYVAKGPPQILLRLLAPVVVASTIVLFGTGVAMLAVHPRAGLLVGLHKASFVVWFVSTGIHVLAYLPRLQGPALGDLRRATKLPSAGLRLGIVGGAVVLGAAFAVSALHLATPWLDWVHSRH